MCSDRGQREAETGLRRLSVLVVEDDETVRQLYASLLAHSGYDVEMANDGEAGWAALVKGQFDLVVTDHNMPKLTGVELVARMRNAGMTVPVIIASGAKPQGTEGLKVAAIVQKPFSATEFLKLVEEVIE